MMATCVGTWVLENPFVKPAVLCFQRLSWPRGFSRCNAVQRVISSSADYPREERSRFGRKNAPHDRGCMPASDRCPSGVYNESAAAMDLRQKRNDILRIAEQYGARNLHVFGSVARGDDRAHSGLDLLVDMDPDRSLLDIVGLGQDLERVARPQSRRVDRHQSAALPDRILAESRPL